MADIFDEVEEDLRAERAHKLLLRYGVWLVAAALLVVAGSGGWQVWQWYRQKEARHFAGIYLAGMEFANARQAAPGAPAATAKQAIEDFARVAAKAPAGYRTLARLQQAALAADSGDAAGAAALWQAVAADASAAPELRDLARLLHAEHLLDSGDPAALAAELAPLARPGSAWRPLAEEAQALLAMRQHQDAEAKRLLQALAQDVTAPQGVRQRASRLLARIGA